MEFFISKKSFPGSSVDETGEDTSDVLGDEMKDSEGMIIFLSFLCFTESRLMSSNDSSLFR